MTNNQDASRCFTIFGITEKQQKEWAAFEMPQNEMMRGLSVGGIASFALSNGFAVNDIMPFLITDSAIQAKGEAK